VSIRRLRARLANRSMAAGLAKRVRQRVRGQLFIDRADPGASYLLAGSPRSGTTWVAEMVAARQNMRLVFEPFHPSEVRGSSAFEHRQYLRPSDDDPRYLDQARRAVSGQLRSSWTDRFNRAVLPRRRLIKEVRANLMLGWLHAHFPGIPIVLVIRHPGGVLASQRTIDWDFNADTERLLAQPALVDDFLGPFDHLLREASTGLRQNVAVWAVENYVPLQQFRRGEIHLVCYEHLLSRPEEEYRRLLSFYGLPFHPEVLARASRPSGVTSRKSAVVSGGDALRSWQDEVSEADRRTIAELIEPFGLGRLYGTGPMPMLDDPNELLRR
jgi:hypothetical protein